jgi:ABC-2 type transport system permease protein
MFRDGWMLALVLIFIGTTWFSLRNGQEKLTRRNLIIAESLHEQRSQDLKYEGMIDSLNRKLLPAPEPWMDPRSLSVYGQRAPRVVAMHSQPLAAISVGQSDLFTHVVRPKLYGEAEALGFSELSNPVQLLFGTFDLSFVITYLLPLLVLAVSYNVLSREREQGSLRLSLAQPISVLRWLAVKMMLRFGAVWLMVIVPVTIGLFWVAGGLAWTGIAMVLLLITLYMAFWFLVSFVVNLVGRSSGANAVTLVACWALLTLLLPSVVSQTANTVYPIPSRTKLIHEYRVAEAEADKRADEILDGYLRDHPELAPPDSSKKNRYGFWLKYFASVDELRKAVDPVVRSFDEALQRQQAWADQFKILSPAMLVQDALGDLAGTSSAHYAEYRRQVSRFASDWRGFFIPRMFHNEAMTVPLIAELPKPPASASAEYRVLYVDLFLLVAYCALVIVVVAVVYGRITPARVLQQG